MHLKRRTKPKFIAVPVTGSKYLARPSHNQNNAISLMLAMRDLLQIVKTKKELKKLLLEKKIIVNEKIVGEINYPVSLFDTLSLPSAKKYFRATLVGSKLQLEPITEKDAHVNVCKVINKTILKGKKVQINLSNGRNIISNEKVNVDDFVMFDNQKKTITKIIPLVKNEKVIVIKGKHMGIKGKLIDIEKKGQNEIAKIKTDAGETSMNKENLFIDL
jgi:small subunit ribosomal protein S4e